MLRPIFYELNVGKVTIVVTSLLIEDIDANIEQINTYEIIMDKLTIEAIVPKNENEKWKNLEDKDSKEEGSE